MKNHLTAVQLVNSLITPDKELEKNIGKTIRFIVKSKEHAIKLGKFACEEEYIIGGTQKIWMTLPCGSYGIGIGYRVYMKNQSDEFGRGAAPTEIKEVK